MAAPSVSQHACTRPSRQNTHDCATGNQSCQIRDRDHCIPAGPPLRPEVAGTHTAAIAPAAAAGRTHNRARSGSAHTHAGSSMLVIATARTQGPVPRITARRRRTAGCMPQRRCDFAGDALVPRMTAQAPLWPLSTPSRLSSRVQPSIPQLHIRDEEVLRWQCRSQQRQEVWRRPSTARARNPPHRGRHVAQDP